MLELLSRKWGGVADTIVPLVNGAIPSPFWDVLAEFDPDWLGAYVPTRRGQQMANPEGFEKWLDEYATKSSETSGIPAEQIRQMVLDDIAHPLTPLYEPTADFKRGVERRTAPNHRADLLVGQRFRADGKIEQPLTDMVALKDMPGDELHLIDAHSVDDDLDLMLSVRFGAVAPSYEKELGERGVKVVRAVPDAIDVQALTRLALWGSLDAGEWGMHKGMREVAGQPLAADPAWSERLFYLRTPFGWSQFRCGWRQYLRKLPLEWPYVLVVGDRYTDFALGFALERLTGFASWVSARLVMGEGELFDDVRHELVRVLDRCRDRSNEPVYVVSTSLEMAALEAAVEKIRAARYGSPMGGEFIFAKTYEDTEHGWPRRLYDERSEDVRYDTFVAGAMAGTLATPLPSVTGTDPEHVTWQVDVLVDGVHVPVRSVLSDLVVAPDDRERDRVRSGAEGVSYHSHSFDVFVFANTPLDQRLARPRLRAPTADDIFGALLANAGLHGVRSNAGRFTEQSLARFGGLDAMLFALRSPIGGAVLGAYRSTAKSGVEPGDWLAPLRRRFLSLDDMAKVTGLEGEEHVADLCAFVDDFVSRKILRRGLALICPVCHYCGWFRLSDLGDDVACQRCRSRWPITHATWHKPADEPKWQYELDEIVFQAVYQNAAGPVLTLDRLRQGTRGDFLFAHEMDVSKDAELVAEVDLWAIVQGHIVIGEAKTTDVLDDAGRDETVAKRLFHIADAISADELVFATTMPVWRERSRAAIARQQEKRPGIHVRILEGVA